MHPDLLPTQTFGLVWTSKAVQPYSVAQPASCDIFTEFSSLETEWRYFRNWMTFSAFYQQSGFLPVERAVGP